LLAAQLTDCGSTAPAPAAHVLQLCRHHAAGTVLQQMFPHNYLPLLLVLLLLAVLLASGAATQLETDLTVVLL
jgi:hypothetical protein